MAQILVAPNALSFPVGNGADEYVMAAAYDPTTSVGDLLYRGSGSLLRLAIGSTGQVLAVSSSGAPYWTAAASGTVPSDYISGLVPTWVSASPSPIVNISPGTAYVQAAASGYVVSGSATTAQNGTYAAAGNDASGNPYYVLSGATTYYISISSPAQNVYKWWLSTSEGSYQTSTSSNSASYSTASAATAAGPAASGTTWTNSIVVTAASGTPAAAVVTITNTIQTQPSSLTASTWYYMYLNTSGSANYSTTAPSTYQGTARNSSLGRYLFCFLTDANSKPVAFARTASGLYRYIIPTNAAPFRTSLSVTTSATNVSAAASVPPTAAFACFEFFNNAYQTAGTANTSTTMSCIVGSANFPAQTTVPSPNVGYAVNYSGMYSALQLDSSRQYQAYWANTGTGNLLADCVGFWEDR